jgi:RES domain-containing protein
MALGDFLEPWSGFGVRHIPEGSPYGILDFRFSSRAKDNRWNVEGQPTLYLASEKDVALAEYARHLQIDRSTTLTRQTRARHVWRLELTLKHVIDLRNPQLWKELSLQNPPSCFLDPEQARAVAQFVRKTTLAEAVLVPSMAFLDKPDRWVMAVFLEKLLTDPLKGDPSSSFLLQTMGFLKCVIEEVE